MIVFGQEMSTQSRNLALDGRVGDERLTITNDKRVSNKPCEIVAHIPILSVGVRTQCIYCNKNSSMSIFAVLFARYPIEHGDAGDLGRMP